MGRPKNKPARKDGYFEYKGVVGQGINGPIRKSFYSKISKNQQKKMPKRSIRSILST